MIYKGFWWFGDPLNALRRRLFYPLNYGESPIRAIAQKTRTGRRCGQRAEYSKRAAQRRGGMHADARDRVLSRDRKSANQPIGESEIDDDEIFLAHVAQRAAPVGGNVGETGAGRDAFVGQPFRFVVHPPANQADPALVFGYFAHNAREKIKIRSCRPRLGRRTKGAMVPEFLRTTAQRRFKPTKRTHCEQRNLNADAVRAVYASGAVQS